MRLTRGILAVVLVGGALLAPGAATGDEGDTLLYETGTGRIEITPGLCFPGAVAGCESPYSAQFRVWFETCTIVGRFEGVDVPEGTFCSGENHGFTYGTIQGWTRPWCGSTHSRTSNETTAWGPGKGNTHTIGTQTREEVFSVVANAGGLLTISGFIDDDDPDTDPNGDHSLVANVVARPISPEGQTACVTGVAQHFTFTSSGVIE